MALIGTSRCRTFYAHPDIWHFRGVERLSDYLKIKGRIRWESANAGADAYVLRSWKRFWRFLTSQKVLAVVGAAGTLALVVIALI